MKLKMSEQMVVDHDEIYWEIIFMKLKGHVQII